MGEQEVVGILTKKVIDTFGLSMVGGTKIICGETDKEHMKSKRPNNF